MLKTLSVKKLGSGGSGGVQLAFKAPQHHARVVDNGRATELRRFETGVIVLIRQN